MSEEPGISAGGHLVPPALAAELAENLRRVMDGPYSVRLLTPLPRRVRLRLAVQRLIDNAGIWLAYHDHGKAARWLWRTTGQW